MGETTAIERLYLCKEKDKDVFVENCNFYDHQIDGLRFLWKQFKKKKPGVLLNFPATSGKSVTISLFLYAIHKLLLQPVIILCKDEMQVQEWHLCLKQWTGFTDEDIIVEPTKALLKKKIFIKSMSDLVSFTRRSWSILVYKDDEYIGMPQFGDVDFYIWATSTDVMKDLNFLSNVYHWMCPKANMKFDNVNGDMRKLILLDALLEDIVLRRNKVTNEEETTIDERTPVKRSKKNKDATGTKIKRTKVKNVIIEPTIDKQHYDIELDENHEVNELITSREINVANELKEKSSDETTGSFETDLNVLNNNGRENTQENCILHYGDETPSDIGSPVHESTILESNFNDGVPIINEDAKNDPSLESSINLNFEDDNEIVDFDNSEKFDDMGVNEAPTSIQESNKSENAVINHNDTAKNNDPESSNYVNFKDDNGIVDLNNSENCNNMEVNEVSTVINEKEDLILRPETKVREKNINESMNLSVVKEECDLDSKLHEMEEKAMKKFKGSFLDSIF